MDDKKPYIAIIVIQAIYAGMTLLSKAAFNGGMNTAVFVCYRQAIGTAVLVPFALALTRSAPSLSFVILVKIFLLALLGTTFSLNVLSVAINYTSAAVASAATNTIPVMTFLLALVFRMETIKLKSISGIAKIFGVALCLAGVLVIAFYEGPSLKSLNHLQLSLLGTNAIDNDTNSKQKWVLGTFLMVVFTTSWSLWIVLQGLILQEYPSKLLFSALCNTFGTIQSFLVGLAFERDFAEWKLHLDEGLLAVAYNGIFVSGIAFYLQAWCIEKKGPVFMAMSQPLALVFTIVCSLFLPGQVIILGSVLGGVLMVGGLYSVLWGKSREMQPTEDMPSPVRPLLLYGSD
ncbi:WAT1-related protein At5g64700-like [Phoenix dactylifera]|uniref:WAT1-related protein n=1 Tax=Phoenix dactylifera TaxID=42345 RepID=A0A8B7BMI0_PHODC|nr:WAT1-related protein At5g64700-like [Phoenix dactylifera]